MVVAIKILTPKIDMKKIEKIKEKIATHNTNIYMRIKIESIFWLFKLKKR